MKIYTKTGDTGETSLFDGTRVSKTHPRVAAYGEVDELQASIGMARAAGLPDDLDTMCVTMQRDLFAVGAQLADPRHRIADRVEKAHVHEAHIAQLERWIDVLDTELPPLRHFILSGGGPAGAALHPGFTPDGPQEIAAFWETGVRYAFVTGPGGVAVEFCARRGESGTAGITGLDHLGLRVPDSAAAAAGLLAAGAVMVAGWQVGRVDVRFLRQDNLMWEVFDEPPVPETPGRWAGVAPR